MKTLFKFLPILAGTVALSAGAAAPQTGSGEKDGYKLVWQDLFDGTELNAARWQCEVNGNGGGNNELQYYTDRPENVRVADDGQGNGCLILTARRESYKGKNFTSGRVISKNKVAFKYGKVEAAIRFPKTANGLWPAFWMMGNDYDQVGWPKCGETDFIEMGNANGISRGTQDRYFNGAMHWGARWDQHGMHSKDKTLDYSLQDGEFHLITATWDNQVVRMYADLDKYPDRKPYFEMTMPYKEAEKDNGWDPGNYFHKENFLLFNVAVGGDFTGIHNAANITALNDDNGQEQSMYINYVKIYQRESDNGSLTSPDGAGDPMPGDDDDDDPEDPGDSGIDSVQPGEPTMSIVGDIVRTSEPAEITVTGLGGSTLLKTFGTEASLASLGKGLYLVTVGNKTAKVLR